MIGLVSNFQDGVHVSAHAQPCLCTPAMVNLIAVLLVPVAVILTDTIGGGSPFAEYNEGRAAWVNFGTCFFGVILTSLFGLPLILYHVQKLSGLGLGLWLASTVVTFGASVSFVVNLQHSLRKVQAYCVSLRTCADVVLDYKAEGAVHLRAGWPPDGSHNALLWRRCWESKGLRVASSH